LLKITASSSSSSLLIAWWRCLTRGILFTAFALKALAHSGWRQATYQSPEQSSNLLLAFNTVIFSFGAHAIYEHIFPVSRALYVL
jgi:hypothetical protein